MSRFNFFNSYIYLSFIKYFAHNFKFIGMVLFYSSPFSFSKPKKEWSEQEVKFPTFKKILIK